MDKITRTNTLNTKSVGQSLKYPPKIRPPSPWYNVDLVNPRGMTITLLTFQNSDSNIVPGGRGYNHFADESIHDLYKSSAMKKQRPSVFCPGL
jgi:hypothetical protein